MHLLRYLALALVAAALDPGFLGAADADDKPPDLLPKLLSVTDQLTNNGVKMPRDGKDVTIILEKPKDLGR